jgi:hypothetical protein
MTWAIQREPASIAAGDDAYAKRMYRPLARDRDFV